MKKISLFAITALALASCQDKSFTVTCTAPESLEIADSTWCYLSSYENGTRSKVYTDSALMIGNHVTIQGQVEGTEVRRFEIGYKSRNYANFILEAGNIDIDIEKREANGSPLNVALSAFNAFIDSVDNSTSVEYRALQKDSTLEADEKREKIDLLWNEYGRTTLDCARTVVAANKLNALGQFVFWQGIAYNEFMTPEVYKKELAAAGEYIANYRPVTAITKRFEALEATQPGTDFVDFTIEHGNIDGSQAKLSDYAGKGKLLLVDMWASWCGPCRRAMPYIRDVYNKYAGDKFDVLSIAVWDERSATLDAIEKLDMTWNHIVEAESIPTELYGVNGIPHLMLIGPDGKIIARSLGDSALDLWVSSELKKME